MKVAVLLLPLLLPSCTAVDANKILEAAGRDQASFCARLSTMYGGGAVIPGPGVPVVGVTGNLYVGRSNQPGSTVVVDDTGCKITHGKEPTSTVTVTTEATPTKEERSYKAERRPSD